MDRPVTDHGAQAADLIDLAVDEFLAAKAGVHRHHAHQIAEIQQRPRRFDRGAGIEREPRLGPGGADGLQGAVGMGTGLQMGGDHIRPGIGEGLDIGIDRRNHQMHVHHGGDVLADGFAQGRAKGQVGHEMPVHDIDMHPIGPLGLDRLNFTSEIGEIGGQDRRRDLDGAVEGHGGVLWLATTGAGLPL